MPAPLAKGIIITLTLLTALGAAVLANPQVQAWIEEQRRKIAETLRSFGDDLDPQSRRQAEAFAFEGRIPGQRPEAARRESAAAREAVAKATGSDIISLDETSRRLTRVGTSKLNETDEAERRRLGREYLARRNQEMLDAKEKAKMRKSIASLSASAKTAPALTEENPWEDRVDTSANTDQQTSQSVNLLTFDSLVDQNGSLRALTSPKEDMEKTLELPSPPTNEPGSFGNGKVPVAETTGPALQGLHHPFPVSGFDAGSRWANPFGDEFELEDTGYATPRARAPAVPPKIALEDPEISVPPPNHANLGKEPDTTVRQIPIDQPEDNASVEDMSFDEQLARALSLSLADEERKRKAIYDKQNEQDPDLAAAIAASLADGSTQTHPETNAALQMTQTSEVVELQGKHSGMTSLAETSQLIDLSPDPPTSLSPPRFPATESPSDDHDSLYSLSPEYKAAQLARYTPVHEPERPSNQLNNLDVTWPTDQDYGFGEMMGQHYDPVHEAASLNSSDEFGSLPESSTAAHAGISKAALMTEVTEWSASRLLIYQAQLQKLQDENQRRQAMAKAHLPVLQLQTPDVLARDSRLSGANTPTTATLSPHAERENIEFSTDSEDDFASAAGSIARDSPASDAREERRASTVSFATDPTHNDFSETESLVGHSDAESVSLVDVNEASRDGEGGDEGSVAEVVEAEESSDEEWSSGVRTPGSEWSDVGSVVSEEEVDGQDSRRLVAQ